MIQALAAAGGMALFNMVAEKEKIEAQNKAAVSAFNATDAAISFTQESNWLRAAEAADEIRRTSATNIRDAKVGIEQKGSTIAMSEGITAGSSKSNILRTYFLQSSEMLGKAVQQTESSINKLAISVEEQNWQYQQKKQEAYFNMQQNLVTGNNATLQIVGSGISGAMAGYQLGSAIGASG